MLRHRRSRAGIGARRAAGQPLRVLRRRARQADPAAGRAAPAARRNDRMRDAALRPDRQPARFLSRGQRRDAGRDLAGRRPREEMTAFDPAFRDALRDLIVWRRDVRRFRRVAPLPGTLERLLQLASLAPSVGLSQPWRFVVVEDAARRAAVRANFQRCNEAALAAYADERARRHPALKLAGRDEAPVHLAAFTDRGTTQGHGLGRRTMPEMAEYSTVMAIHTMWLVARAEGPGLGGVAIAHPPGVAANPVVAPRRAFPGFFCPGFPLPEDTRPP